MISNVGTVKATINSALAISIYSQHKIYLLNIIGEFSLYQNELKKKYACDNIEFLGKVDHDQLCKYYQNAKAHITLSESETYCLTLLESVACGTPIIYPNCNVFNEIYQNDFPEL